MTFMLRAEVAEMRNAGDKYLRSVTMRLCMTSLEDSCVDLQFVLARKKKSCHLLNVNEINTVTILKLRLSLLWQEDGLPESNTSSKPNTDFGLDLMKNPQLSPRLYDLTNQHDLN